MPHNLNHVEKFEMLHALDRAIEVSGKDETRAEPLRRARALIGAITPNRSCRLCMDYRASGFCAAWKRQIPPEWIEVGCDKWLDDDIPF